MNVCNFCTHLTFDLILRLKGIFRLGIHPSVVSYMPRNIFSMDAKMHSKMPTYFLALWIGNFLLSSHLLRNSCPLSWPFLLIVFCLFVIFINFPIWFKQDFAFDCSSCCSLLYYYFQMMTL